MDTLAHGLWGAAVFGQKAKGHWKWAFWLGMAPDLLSFGPFFATRLGSVLERWGSRQRLEPPDPATIPAYTYHAYDVTHSLVVWTLAAAILWIVSARRRTGVSANSPFRPIADAPLRPLWPFAAWALHILCDIPTHSTQFFPTPYLWPLDTPFVNGRSWGQPPFTLINYILLAMTYAGLWFYRRRRAPVKQSRNLTVAKSSRKLET